MASPQPTMFDYYRRITSSVSEQPRANTLRDQMETGDIRTAKRYTRGTSQYSETFILTNAQYQDFLDWWANDAAYGSLYVTVEHPITGETIDARPFGEWQSSAYDTKGQFIALSTTWERYL